MANRGQGQRPNQHNFRTDPHRMKTQKWVNAHQYSYDGDDWGNLDEFNEYDGYEQAASKPTGLRQPGQGLRMSTDAARNVSNPEPPSSAAPAPGVRRAPSFESGDDKRYFSAGSGPPSQPPWGPASPAERPSTASPPPNIAAAAAATAAAAAASGGSSNNASQGFRTSSQSMASQGQAPPNANYRTSQTSQPGSYGPRAVSGQGLPTSTSRPTSNQPDQIEAPASPAKHTAAGIAASSAAGHPPGARFPPRQSSLSSQGSEPEGPIRPFSSSMPKHQEETQEEESAQNADIAAEATPRPFIRPADIYKRMAEEREKERQSMDSNRPSMDTIENAAGSSLAGTSSERNLRPLETLPERKSEYGMEGIDVPKMSQHEQAASKGSVDVPLLPKLDRFSMFGDDMWSSDLQSTANAPSLASDDPTNQAHKRETGQEDAALQHQPSQGYRTAVKQAFDGGPMDSSSASQSAQDSQATPNESDVSRSNTDSTAGISPIMARHTSQGAPADSIATITEENPSPDDRQAHGTLSGPFQVPPELVAPPSSHSRNISGSSSTPTVRPKIPETRGESPARAPSIEPAEDVAEGASAQIDMTTPVEPKQAQVPTIDTSRFSHREADLAEAVNASPEAPPVGTSEAILDAQTEFLQNRGVTDNKSATDLTQVSAEPGSTPAKDITGVSGRRNSGDSIASWASSNDENKKVIETGEYSSAGATDGAQPQQLASIEHGIVTQSQGREQQGSDILGSSSHDASIKAQEDESTSSHKMTAAAVGAGAIAGASLVTATALKHHGKEDDLKAQAQSTAGSHAPTLEVTSDPVGSSAAQESYESDRLRDEIEKTLIATSPTLENPAALGSSGSHLSPKDAQSEFPRQSTVSSLYPREYDSYWASGGGGGGSGSVSPAISQQQDDIPAPAVQPAAWDASFSSPKNPATKPSTSPRLGMLNKRFSWEDDVEEPEAPPVASTVIANDAAPVPQPESPNASKARESTASKGTDNSVNSSAPAGRESSDAAIAGAGTRAAVTNANPTELSTPSEKVGLEGAAKRVSSLPQSSFKSATPQSPTTHQTGEDFGTGAKPPPHFKDIAAIKQSSSRIETFQKTRTHFSGMDTGLSNWLTYMIESNPENAKAVSGTSIAAIPGSGGFTSSVRQKLPGAIGKLSTRSASSGAPVQQPYYQQYLDAASSSQANSPNNTSTGYMSSPAAQGDSPSGQKTSPLQSNRDKLMQQASSFGGKASHGAKGLFNKGRSRLMGGSSDKVSPPTNQPKGTRSSSKTRWSNLRQSLPFGSSPASKEEEGVQESRTFQSNQGSWDVVHAATVDDVERSRPAVPPKTQEKALPSTPKTPLDPVTSTLNSRLLDSSFEPPRPFAQDSDGDAEASDAEEWHDAVQEPEGEPTQATVIVTGDDQQVTSLQEAGADHERDSREERRSFDAKSDISAVGKEQQQPSQAVVARVLPGESAANIHSRTVSAISDNYRISSIGGSQKERASHVSSVKPSDIVEPVPDIPSGQGKRVSVATFDYPIPTETEQTTSIPMGNNQIPSGPASAPILSSSSPYSYPVPHGGGSNFLGPIGGQSEALRPDLNVTSKFNANTMGSGLSGSPYEAIKQTTQPLQQALQSNQQRGYQLYDAPIEERDFAQSRPPVQPRRASEPSSILDENNAMRPFPSHGYYSRAQQEPITASQTPPPGNPIRTASAVRIQSVGPKKLGRNSTGTAVKSDTQTKPEPKRTSFFGGLFSSSDGPSGQTTRKPEAQDAASKPSKDKARKLSKSAPPSDTRAVSSSVVEGRRNQAQVQPSQKPNSYAIPPPPMRVHSFPIPGQAADAASIVTSYNTPRQPRLPDLERMSGEGDEAPNSQYRSRFNTDKPLPPGGMTDREWERETHIAHLAGKRVFGSRASPFEHESPTQLTHVAAPDSDQISNRRSYSTFQPPRNTLAHVRAQCASAGSPPRSYYTYAHPGGAPTMYDDGRRGNY